jgi:hypothetical protein
MLDVGLRMGVQVGMAAGAKIRVRKVAKWCFFDTRASSWISSMGQLEVWRSRQFRSVQLNI